MFNHNLAELLQQFPHSGELLWIGLRPAKGEAMQEVAEALADPNTGLAGDRYQGRSGSGQVTLIQWEHLQALSSFTRQTITPEMLRRNLLIKGINLLALKNQRFRIGNVLLQGTGLCQPCSKMEHTLGTGGYNAMRGHGGLTAQVLVGGQLRVGDAVGLVPEAGNHA